MGSTPIPPIIPGPDADKTPSNPIVGDVPGTDPDLLERDADGNLIERDAPVADLDEAELAEAREHLDGAAVVFESQEAAESDDVEQTTGSITVTDATPERLGADVQDGPADR